MPQFPKVTILMPVFNGEEYLRQAIVSILEQTFTDFEFLIINDGSMDSSVDIIQSYDDERIRLIHNKKNLKLISTLNKGIRLSRGQYIARMDCDDISHPERIAKQVAFMEANPEVGVLGTGIFIIDRNGKRKYKFRYPTKHNFLHWSLCFYSPIVHPAVMIRKNLLMKVGGYDHGMVHAEDYDLWRRLIKKTRFSNLQDYLLCLRKHESNVTKEKLDKHLENTTKINHKLISEILGENLSADIVMRIRSNKFKSYNEQIKASKLVARLYECFINDNELLPKEKVLIKRDASIRLLMIAAPRIYDVRAWKFLLFALQLDPFLIYNYGKKMIDRFTWPEIFSNGN